jgi:hypothetical protein
MIPHHAFIPERNRAERSPFATGSTTLLKRNAMQTTYGEWECGGSLNLELVPLQSRGPGKAH